LFSIWQKPYRATKTLEILAWRIKMKISKYLVTPLAIAVILSASSSGVEAKKGGGKGRGGHSTLSGKRDAEAVSVMPVKSKVAKSRRSAIAPMT
jgi:hypothetical protein